MNLSQCLNPDCLCRNPDTSKFCQQCGSKLLLAERYRAIRILGQGGFGRTFLSVDEYKPSQPACVIKQFLPQAQGTDNVEKAAELFAQEAVRLEELGKHDQIPELLAYFTVDNRQYLVQEFIAGQTLAQELAEKGVFKEQQIRDLLQDILSVLQFVHSKNVIHRDIKPENVISRQQDGKLVLVDFGASKFLQNINLSVTGTVIGSAEYAAPEQAKGKPKFVSDLYSLGVTCIHLLTGISPFELFDDSEGDWVWRNYLVNNPISNELGHILDKLIESATKRRYSSAAEVLAALNSQPWKTNVKTVVSPPPVVANSGSGNQVIQLQKFSFDVVTITGVERESSGFLGLGEKRSVKTQKNRQEAEYFTEDLGNGVTLDMVSIPGGTFLMGSPFGEGYDSERPQHQVTVPFFFMGKFAVTQAQWRVIASLPKVERDLNPEPSHFKGDNRPVEEVNWYDAVEFCARLSKLTGREYRLPSEAEWEYACRGIYPPLAPPSEGGGPKAPLSKGDLGGYPPFHFGETITTDLANYDGNYTYGDGPEGQYRGKTTPVGQFPANGFGLYDMHGNVWEWCADTWHENYVGAPTDGSAWIRGGNQSCSVLRGGSWVNPPEYCRSDTRDYIVRRDFRDDQVGFRVVCGFGRIL